MTNLMVAAVPEYGLSPPAEVAGTISLIANDSGSRGWPWDHGLLPVNMVNGKAQVIINGQPKPPPYSAKDLFLAFKRVRRKRDVPPYELSLSEPTWPAGGQFALLLLLFWQSKDIGGATGYWTFDLLTPTEKVNFLKEATKAVNTYLLAATEDDLYAGLIKQKVSTGTNTGTDADPVKRPQPQGVTIALASCQYPSDILDRMPNIKFATRGPADAPLLALADRLLENHPPTMLLLAGDQVYVDATAGMFDPKILDDKYRAPYQRRGQSWSVQAVTQALGRNPCHQLLDDHEISDNWDRGEPDQAAPDSALNLGREAYWLHQRPDKFSTIKRHQLWRDTVVHNGFPFFLADTRTERDTRNASNADYRSIMSPKQFWALKAWLASQDAAKPKFIASSSALLPRHLSVARNPATSLHSDAWDAYPHSMFELLAFICELEVKGLVFLSGDQHISNVVEATVSNVKTRKTCNFHSVHSSALYAPYPFANAVPEDFERFETFEFSSGGSSKYRCHVASTFVPPGDGFAVLSVTPSGGSTSASWQLAVAFHDSKGIKADQLETKGILLLQI